MIAGASIFAASWIVLSAVGGVGYSAVAGYCKRKARSYTDWTLSQPPVPAPLPEVDDGWLDVWPTCEDAEQAVFDALFRAIPEVAADLRDHA